MYHSPNSEVGREGVGKIGGREGGKKGRREGGSE